MRFCHRVGVWDFSFRYKVVGVCKNRDTKREPPVSAGAACAAITNLSGDHEVFAAQKPITYSDLFGPGLFKYLVEAIVPKICFILIYSEIDLHSTNII